MHQPADTTLTDEVDVDEPPQQIEAGQEEEQAEIGEGAQRFVIGIDAQDGGSVAFDEIEVAFDQPRFPQRSVGLNGHAGHGQALFAGLDDRFQGVGVFGEDGQLHGRFPAEGAKAAGGVGHRRIGGQADHPTTPALQESLQRGEMGDGLGLPVADDDVGPAGHNRPDQGRHGLAGVLVVAIGVDDDVGPQTQAGVQPGLKDRRQPPVVGVADDVVHSMGPGHGHSVISAAVVDDQRFQPADAVNLLRQIGQGLG